MKGRFIVILVLAVLMTVLWSRVTKPPSKPEPLLQGRTVLAWLHKVEFGGDLYEKHPASEVLISAGPAVIADLSEVMLAPESIKDLALRLPNVIVPVDTKRRYANESVALSLKAQAAEVLGVIAYRNPDAPEVVVAIPSLINGLQSGSPEVRCISAQALGAIGQRASNAIPALIPRVTDDDSSLRMCAVEAIGRIGVNTPATIAALTLALSDSNGDVCVTAKQVLEALQKPARIPNSNQ